MANCPKCNHKLKVTDVSQFCPKCGVNMRFCNFEENFIREAKIAELSQATVHVKIKRLKAALIGSKLSIVRLCVALLPVLALLIPSGSFTFSLPYTDVNISLGALGIYQMFTNGDFNYINVMCDSVLFGDYFAALRLALFSYAGAALMCVVVLLSTILCFISIKNMQKVIAGISFAGVIVCAVNAVLTMLAVSKVSSSGFSVLSAKSGFGVCIIALMFVVVAVVNIILNKKGIPVEYAEGMLERVEIWNKVKAGELDINNLPQPVVETEETRKIDEEIAKEEEKFLRIKAEKEAEKNSEGGND